jgi:hypothetical protein
MASKEPFLLGKGWVHSRDLMYFYGSTVDDDDNNRFESVVVRWNKGVWGLWQVATRLCGVCTTGDDRDRRIICAGIDGYVEVSDRNGVNVEAIDASAAGPNNLKHVTCVRSFGDHVLAVGMARMVYRRDAAGGGWRRLDDGVRVPKGSAEVAGFKSVDQCAEGRYIAGGFYGDLWLHEHGQWRRLPSPTNVKLEAVRWANDDLIYVAGGGGILLRGHPDALEVVPQSSTKATFWSIEWYRSELYLATRAGSIWVLRGDELEPVDLGGERTTGWLHANDDVLLSVGEHDAMVYDGATWNALEPPPSDASWPLQW